MEQQSVKFEQAMQRLDSMADGPLNLGRRKQLG